MQGVFYEEHGDTDVLQYGDLPDPEVGRDEVLEIGRASCRERV